MKKTQQLRQLLNSGQTLLAPGIFDGLSARLVERAGFKVIYASGGAMARSAGYPDIGLLSVTEVSEALARIVDVTHIPVIADADTGFGNAINVQRTVKIYERCGAAALHLEDQTFPKRCGHLNDKNIISQAEMVHKIKVARDSLQDNDFVLIARTDAIAVEGFEQALERAHAYLEAGADVIFVEAPETLAQITAIAKQIRQPKLINMFYGAKTPLVSTADLEKMGYNIVIIPSDLQRAAIHAMEKTLAIIKQDGNSAKVADQLTSFADREKIVETEKYLQIKE